VGVISRIELNRKLRLHFTTKYHESPLRTVASRSGFFRARSTTSPHALQAFARSLPGAKNTDPAPQGGTPTVAGVEALAGQGGGGSATGKNADPAPQGCTPTLAGVEALAGQGGGGSATGKNADPAPQGGTPTLAGVEALAGQGVGGSATGKNADPAPKGCTPTVAGVEALAG